MRALLHITPANIPFPDSTAVNVPGYALRIVLGGGGAEDGKAGRQGRRRRGRRSRLRASHADREHVIDVLKAAFVQGRLDSDEFACRVDHALGTRTCAELAAVTVGLSPDSLQPSRPSPPGCSKLPTLYGCAAANPSLVRSSGLFRAGCGYAA
jgi:Domain of unknown function (DUF1707)